MEDVNHRLSKTLVQHYGANTLFVLEDLTNVSFDEKNQGTRDRNRDLHSWSFYDLQVKLTYKSQANQSQVLIVSAKYTSQRCPKCGQICKKTAIMHYIAMIVHTAVLKLMMTVLAQ